MCDRRQHNYNRLTSFPGDDKVPLAATFAGTLHFRAEILANIEAGLPIAQWSVAAILPYFISKSGLRPSFHPYFEQTRVRVYLAVVDQLADKASKLQRKYLKAVLQNQRCDYVHLPGFSSYYWQAFVHEFKRHPEAFGRYVCYAMERIAGKLANTKKEPEGKWDSFAGSISTKRHT